MHEIIMSEEIGRAHVRLRALSIIFDTHDEKAQEQAKMCSLDGDWQGEGLVLEEVFPPLAEARYHWLEADRIYRRALSDALLTNLSRDTELVLLRDAPDEFTDHIKDVVDFAVDVWATDHKADFSQLEFVLDGLWSEVCTIIKECDQDRANSVH